MKKLEINKNDLENNINVIKKIVNDDAKIIAVVKANGMGLGLVEYSQTLINNGIQVLAVANFEEAITLRKANIESEILMLSPTIIKKELQLLIENDITITIGSSEEIKLIEEILETFDKKEIKAHLKIDTGFGRYGFLYTEKEHILEVLSNLNKIKICGTYTHFSKPNDEKWTRTQFKRFMEVILFLKNHNMNLGILHCASSTAFLKYPEMKLDAVRIGSAFQGRILTKNNDLIKIGKFKSIITEIKTLPKGYNISYGHVCKTRKITKIAVIPVGYMDGLNYGKLRDDYSLKNNLISVGMEIKKIFKDNCLKVTIKNSKFKIIGRLGMYHSIVDITDCENINVGDEVELNISPLQANDEIRREYI